MAKFIYKIINKIVSLPILNNLVNQRITNSICNATYPRPRPFSLWSHQDPTNTSNQQAPGEYTSWPMLSDRNYSARHLPPSTEDYNNSLPIDKIYISESDCGDITALFQRNGDMKTDRTSVLFMFFAQWFTDSILRFDPNDRRKNTSNHNIDLSQIYGLSEKTCKTLRRNDGSGKLRSQVIKGEEYLNYLGEEINGSWKVKEIYKSLPYAEYIDEMVKEFPESKNKLYATGLDRGNSSLGYVAISTIFVREHNRICHDLKNHYNNWDDERIFQTARMINTVILMKLVIQDYINHIAGIKIFKFDATFAENEKWYRTPWIAVEFSLLYRWHGLIPDSININGVNYAHTKYRFNNELFEKLNINNIITAASQNAAGVISLKNVPSFMLRAEYHMIKMGRDSKLASYNEYREHFGLKRINSFKQLTDDKELSEKLGKLYNNNINNLELTVGLFAEKRTKNQLYGDLMYAMVAYDAFTQIYTNPLLSKNIYTKSTFTEYGLNLIEKTDSIKQLVDRNSTSDNTLVSFDISSN